MRSLNWWSTVEDWPTGFHNPRTNIIVRSSRGHHVLQGNHGSGDEVHVFKDGMTYYVLSMRPGIPYVGLNRYDVEEKDAVSVTKQLCGWTMSRQQVHTPDGTSVKLVEPVNEVFAQGDQVADYIGETKFLRTKAPVVIAKKLCEWID